MSVIECDVREFEDKDAQHNISARQIRLDYEARQHAAQAQQAPTDSAQTADTHAQALQVVPTVTGRAQTRWPSGRRGDEVKKEDGGAASKGTPQAKDANKPKKRHIGVDPEDTGDEELAQSHFLSTKHAKRVPGQIDNCVECGVRFTVTPYTNAAPEEVYSGGGLLCAKCAKDVIGSKKLNGRSTVSREKRRQIQSKLLDGHKQRGAKSLLQLCIEKVAKHINQIDDFGDMPPQVLDRLSRILSKSRAIDSTTIQLFLKPDIDVVSIYDCSKLEVNDYKKMLAFAPVISSLTLLNASQFQNPAMEYFTQRIKALKKLHLHSANLIDDTHWQSFFIAHGGSLESLRLEFLDHFFTLDTIKIAVSECTGLKSLRLEHLNHLTDDDAVGELSKLGRLEHLTIRLGQDVTSGALMALIEAIGNNLRTLAIKDCACLDRSVLTAIQTNCHRITHLKLTGADKLPFSEFSTLFSNWQNPPLIKIDLSEVGSLNTRAKSDQDMDVVGAHDALESLMAHSGDRLEKLDLHSCRPVSHAALCSAFTEAVTYPRLKKVDLSFIQDVDDFVVESIVRCCPKMDFLTVSLLASSSLWQPI
ncbi:MAG: hypothetical protein M1840_007140 [Geoglossum simile]|nr:MAG: hypothetical protein M1840_007140 [Geoglossum simile]